MKNYWLDQQPLNTDEKQILIDNGWKFAKEDYIYMPFDYDGCMADGMNNIRRILRQIIERQK
jgi:hypothetical protein